MTRTEIFKHVETMSEDDYRDLLSLLNTNGNEMSNEELTATLSTILEILLDEPLMMRRLD